MKEFDGTAGIPAIMLEMLVISEPGLIKLLSALPGKWAKGKLEGVLCRGAVEVGVCWDMPKKKILAKFLSSSLGDRQIIIYHPPPFLSLLFPLRGAGRGVHSNLPIALQQVTVKFPASVGSVRSTGLPLSIKSSRLGRDYRVITLPADKQISIEVNLL